MKDDRQSFTAEASAIMREMGRHESSLLLRNPDFLARRLIRKRYAWLTGCTPLRRYIKAHADRAFPGLYEGHLARTHFYDKCVGDALAGGIRQYVILGAGFDSRPHRLAPTDCKVFEVDHPATGRVKQQRVAGAGLDASNVTYVGVDFLRQDTRQRLLAEGLDPALPTLFTWEGVTMYLDREAVSDMLRFVGSMPPGSTIVFDYFFADVISHPHWFKEARVHLDYVKKIREPYTFGVNLQDMDDVVGSCGLALIENLGPGDLDRRFLPGHPRGVNDWYAIAKARKAYS